MQANIGCPYTFSQRCSHLGRTGNSTIRPHHFPMETGLWYPVCTRLNELRLCSVSSFYRWTKLEDYWHSVLFIWNTRLRMKLTRRQSRFDKLSTPMLHSVDIIYKGNGRALAGQPKPSGLTLRSADNLIFRPGYLFRVCGDTITGVSVYVSSYTSRGSCHWEKCLL